MDRLEKEQLVREGIKDAMDARKSKESFSDMVLRIMKEQDMTGPDVYKAANVSRSVFSKLASDKEHVPRKHIALAIALSLHLDTDEIEELINKAGYALSDYVESDVIISYCISKDIKDVFEVNQILHLYGLPLLGSRR